jgi:Domain of unknown function (DUF4157)
LSDRARRPAARTAEAGPSAGPRSVSSAWPLLGLQRQAGNRAVQRLVDGEHGALDGAAVSARIGEAEESGQPIDGALRERLADALGDDPGAVRVHADPEADALSRDLGARAFTSGRDIFFRSGAFEPSTSEGFELLAHESTHVLQQAAGPVAGTTTADGALSISDPGDPFERAASSKGSSASASAPSADG